MDVVFGLWFIGFLIWAVVYLCLWIDVYADWRRSRRASDLRNARRYLKMSVLGLVWPFVIVFGVSKALFLTITGADDVYY